MANIQIFENQNFGKIRTVMQDGEPWFVGKDVAEILGYVDTFGAIKKHVDLEDKQNCQNDSFESNRGLTVINESGLYSLILSSKLPIAKKFKHWVTAEVLPSIRKHGGYIAGQEDLTDEELMAKALLVAQRKIEEKNQKILALEADNERMKPKEIFTDAVTASSTSILVQDLAKLLRQNGIDIGEKRLYKWMREEGYICKGSTAPTQRAMDMGLFEVQVSTIQRADREPIETRTTKVTGKGQVYFINKFLH